LRSPNGDNSTCPVHRADYGRRLSPRSVFFSADKQAQDHHARDLRDSPKHFRSLTIARTQQSPLAGTHGIGVDDLTSVHLTRVLHDLRDKIHTKETNLQLPADHSQSGTERRRTDSHNATNNTKTFAKVTKSSAKQSMPSFPQI
jgi:hypothetical protein